MIINVTDAILFGVLSFLGLAVFVVAVHLAGYSKRTANMICKQSELNELLIDRIKELEGE